MTQDTVSLSIAFEHSISLRTCRRGFCFSHEPAMSPEKYEAINRVVRVVLEDTTRSRTTTCRLPTELLIKIFENVDSCKWQHDLLSFAQVCRRWSCSLGVLFARLEDPEGENHCHFPWLAMRSPDPYAFAKAFTNAPVLGLGIRHLVLDEHVGVRCSCDYSCQRRPTGFISALVAVLRATKDLQDLHISQVYSSRENTVFSALPELSDLRTLAVTRTICTLWPENHGHDSISTVQLAHCMARWPTLTSLTVEGLMRGSLGIWRFLLRRPACALTQLCLCDSHISNTDLQYLTASSANTLAQVILQDVGGITAAGLHAFLDSISQQITSLTVILWREYLSVTSTTEHALDSVVDKMPCLEVLSIGGNVASERMLRRRSDMFARGCSSGDAAVPVVRLSTDFVPGLKRCRLDEGWPGWQMVELR